MTVRSNFETDNAESYPEFSVVFLESQNPERDDSLGLKETA